MKITIETWMNDNLREVVVEVHIPYILSNGKITISLEGLLKFKSLNERFNSLSINEDEDESIKITAQYVSIKITFFEIYRNTSIFRGCNRLKLSFKVVSLHK